MCPHLQQHELEVKHRGCIEEGNKRAPFPKEEFEDFLLVVMNGVYCAVVCWGFSITALDTTDWINRFLDNP